MKTSAKAVLATALLVVTNGTALGASRTYELDAFTAVDISSGINAEIEVGPAQSIRAESQYDADLEDLIIEVRDGKLVARIDWSLLDLFSFGERSLTLHITVPALDSVESSSGADIDVTGLSGQSVSLNSSSGANIDAVGAFAGSFRIGVSSGADIDVEGACGSAKIDVSSGATLRADRLGCADVDIDASSGASARVFASSSLKANASSGADIEVRGKPTSVDKEESSGGGIEIED